MSFNLLSVNYEFSKEVQNDLLEFKKVVEAIPHESDSRTWEDELQTASKSPNTTIYEISDDSNDCQMINEVKLTQLDQTIPGSFGDTEILITELLISKTQVKFSDEFINRLGIKCTKNDSLFKTLLPKLCDSAIINLGNSLLSSNSSSSKTIFLYFKDILLPKMLDIDCNKDILELTNKFLNKHWTDLQDIFIQYLYKSNSNITNNLEQLSAENQGNILRQFILTLTMLQENHLDILLMLFSKCALENDALKKLIGHMVLVAADFSEDKRFGKLITGVIKAMKGNVLKTCIEHVKYITNEHKSFWRGHALKLLNAI